MKTSAVLIRVCVCVLHEKKSPELIALFVSWRWQCEQCLHTKKAILLFLTTWALLVLLLLVLCEGNWLFFVLRWKSVLEVATISVRLGIRFGRISFP